MSKILVIEDEDILLDLLQHALGQDGHEVLRASDGQTGVELARQHTPDLIISDMSMPKMTGWQVIEAIRADDNTKAIPIIALTAHTTAEDRSAGYDAGVSSYQEKPIDMQRLKKKSLSFFRVIVASHKKDSKYGRRIGRKEKERQKEG